MAEKDPQSPDPQPSEEPRDGEAPESDEPTVLIDSALLEAGYMVRPRVPGMKTTDEIPNVTEAIPVDEVQDVVVLIDDDDVAPATEAIPQIAEDVDVLLTNPANADTSTVLATEMLPVGELPELENVEDITSLISDADPVELRAPTSGAHFDIHMDPEPVPAGRSLGWVWATAAVALLCAGGYFASQQYGWNPWEQFMAGDEKVAKNDDHRADPPRTGHPGSEVPHANAVQQREQFRQWIETALAAHLGDPVSTPR